MENNEEERKQTSRRVHPFTRSSDQFDPDFALTMMLQEQERALALLSTMESDDSSSDEDEDEINPEGSNTDENNDYEFFERNGFDVELGFLEEEDIEEDEDMEEEEEGDEIDVDELTYEELIAIGEFIGVEKRGLSINEISNCLQPCKCESIVEKTIGIDRCVICQVEYEEGEELVALPNCHHPYHSDCITKWLQLKKICPICSTEVSAPKNIARN